MGRVWFALLSCLILANCSPARMGTKGKSPKKDPAPQSSPSTPKQEPSAPTPQASPPPSEPQAGAPGAHPTPSAQSSSPPPSAPPSATRLSTQPVIPPRLVDTPTSSENTSGSEVPLNNSAGPNSYIPGLTDSAPTCVGEACARSAITDAGKYLTEQNLRFKPKTRKLEILFVLDTSTSMHDEHAAIAREIGAFIAELSPEVSYRLGVMLAHGPNAKVPGVKVGHLYTKNAGPLVLDGDAILAEVKRDSNSIEELNARSPGLQGEELEKAQRKQASQRLAHLLKQRLQDLPLDRSNAQGEAGLLNLYKAFSGAQEKSELKRAGLLQEDSALLVVTVADEQDMCFDYAAASAAAGTPIKGNYSREQDRRSEEAAFLAHDTCARVANGHRLTPKHVFDAIKAAKGDRPVVFSGIHYLNDNLPTKTDKDAGDNEPGRGYLDLIKLGDGQAVDLSTEDFGKTLAEIGKFSNFRMKWEDTFVIPGKVDAARLDPNSIGVFIKSGNGEVHPVATGNVRVRINEKTRQPEVVIDYQSLEYAYEREWIDEGAKLIIEYGYKDKT